MNFTKKLIHSFREAERKSNELYITKEAHNNLPMRQEINERMKLAHESLPVQWTNRQFRVFPSILDFHDVQLGAIAMKVNYNISVIHMYVYRYIQFVCV